MNRLKMNWLSMMVNESFGGTVWKWIESCDASVHFVKKTCIKHYLLDSLDSHDSISKDSFWIFMVQNESFEKRNPIGQMNH